MALNKNTRFDLKLHYNRIFEISIIISLILLIAAFKFIPNMKKSAPITEPVPELIIIENPISTVHKSEIITPPQLPSIIISEDILADETILPDIDILSDVIPITDVKPPDIEPDDNEPVIYDFLAVEEKPELIGGVASVAKNVVYPDLAVQVNAEGLVTIKVLVNEKGDVIKAELVKGIGWGCDEAAMDAAMNAKFNPGRQRGKPVKVYVNIPVRFDMR